MRMAEIPEVLLLSLQNIVIVSAEMIRMLESQVFGVMVSGSGKRAFDGCLWYLAEVELSRNFSSSESPSQKES